MSEQYAFAIGFDADATELSSQQEADWQVLMQQISQGMTDAHLPSLSSERWDEFGYGRVFWGCKADCEAVQQILVQFPVLIQEERNLDEGFYAIAGQRYYVTTSGEIYGLPGEEVSEPLPYPQPLLSIPLDAYRLNQVSAALKQYVGTRVNVASIHRPEPVPELPVIENIAPESANIPDQLSEETVNDQLLEETTVEPVFESSSVIPFSPIDPPSEASEPMPDSVTSALIEDLQSEISTLKAQVAALSHDLAGSRAIASEKIEPEHFAALEEESAEKQRQLEQLEQQLQSMQATSATAISKDDHEILQQQLAQRTAQTVELEQRLQHAETEVVQLQASLQHFQQHIDPQTHSALQSQLQNQETERGTLQTKLRTLETELQQQQAELETNNRLAQERNDTLVQDSLAQSTQMAELERTIRQLDGEVRQLGGEVQHWKAIAAEKVDFIEYQRAQQELMQLRSRLRQGLRGRLLGWLFR
jgi:hypothetical protein